MMTAPDSIAEPEQAAQVANRPAVAGITRLDPARSLRRHKLLALLAMLLTLAAGLPLAWLKGAPKYMATAVIYVSPRFVANLQDGKEIDLQSDSQYHEYLQQSAHTVNRFDIVLAALKKTGAGQKMWVQNGEAIEHAAERLQRALDIKAIENTYQIAVSLEGSKPSGIAELVNSVVDTFLTTAKSEEFFDSAQRVKNLTEDRARLRIEADQLQARRLEIAQQLGVSSFSENFVNPYDSLQLETKEAVAGADKERVEAEAMLASLDDQQRPGGTNALRALGAAEALKDSSITTLNEKLNIRRTQLMALLTGLSPDHPGRRSAERELAEIEQERDRVLRKLIDSYSANLLIQKKADAYKAARVEQKLSGELAKQTSQASWFARNYQEGLQLGVEADSARKRIDTLQQRIDFLSLEKSAPGFVRLFSAARSPSEPASGGRKKLYLLVLVAALACGLLAPIGADLIDPRIQSLGDVERVLGFLPIAWFMEHREAGPDFAREQVLRLANRLAQEEQTTAARIFAFTSVKARGGTSTIVMETASALGRLGVPALAVEANAYRADPRYRDPHSRGLTVVLRGNRDLRDAVVPGSDDMPDYVPIGDISNEKNLPDIQNLSQILRDSTASYRAILVDLPPILVSVDAEFLARTADVVILVIESQAVNKDELARAASSLERLHVSAVSAVLNRVRLNGKDGAAESALHEFRFGSAAKPSGWLRRLLWN